VLYCAVLDDAVQTVMGWTESHLYQSEKDGKAWGAPENDEFGDLDIADESKVRTPPCQNSCALRGAFSPVKMQITPNLKRLGV